jgi:hypothetical protein
MMACRICRNWTGLYEVRNEGRLKKIEIEGLNEVIFKLLGVHLRDTTMSDIKNVYRIFNSQLPRK